MRPTIKNNDGKNFYETEFLTTSETFLDLRGLTKGAMRPIETSKTSQNDPSHPSAFSSNFTERVLRNRRSACHEITGV